MMREDERILITAENKVKRMIVMETTAVKLKTRENGDLIIPGELMNQVGLAPQTEVDAHIDEKCLRIEFLPVEEELKRAKTIDEIMDILERRGIIRFHKPNYQSKLTPEEAEEMHRQLNKSLKGKSLPIEEIIERERQERDDMVRL